MSFLQPLFLLGIPLIALPIIIHLINQRRYQTIQWAAMMFLLNANRMSRGYARLRQWLILLFRTLAILGLIVALARPLASGSLGALAGGQPDTTIIVLDRSPSMQQRGADATSSKLESGRRQLAQTLGKLGSSRWVLVESTASEAREIESAEALLELPSTGPTDSSADLPAMLEAARDYVKANKTGRTEVWICSDVRSSDWQDKSGRWQAIRDSFLELPQGIRFHLLAYPDVATDNISIRVTEVRREQRTDGAALLVSLHLARDGDVSSPLSLPIQFEIDGARSEIMTEIDGATFELQDHRIPIDADREKGWGKVSIPADANLADNEFYFVFDEPPPREALVVGENPQVAEILRLVAAIPPNPAITCGATQITPDELATADWNTVSLLLWQAALPEGDAAKVVSSFVDRGGQVMFLPPATPNETEFRGIRWQEWVEELDGAVVETWRGDQDILSNTQSGMSLPVGKLRVGRYCQVAGELTVLATLKGGHPLLARLPTNRGAVYFCATTPALRDSSMATDGIVLYVLTQRALAAGAEVLSEAKQLIAGDDAESALQWRQVAGLSAALSTEYVHRSGVYAAGTRLLAVNREVSEDETEVVPAGRVAGLFDGLEFSRVDDRAGRLTGLVQEIWRLALLAMMVALLAEAALCLPRKRTAVGRQPRQPNVGGEPGNGQSYRGGARQSESAEVVGGG